jgi:protease IV
VPAVRVGSPGVRLSAIVLLALACSVVACGGEDDEEALRNPARRELAEIRLLSAPTDGNQPSLFGGGGSTLREVLVAIDEARTDEHVVGLFLRLGPMGSAWGRVGDLREALQAVRDAGKPVHCHFETLDNAGYLLAATACDRLTMTPAGMLDAVGVAAQVFYARSMLESLGIQADILQVGTFKGAAEPLTRDEMSEETRESLGALLDTLEATLVSGIAGGRHMSEADAQAALDAGPYDSASALAAHLVDAVEYDDQARTDAREASGATRNRVLRLGPEPTPMTLGQILDALSGTPPDEEPEADHIVLAYLEGEINDGETNTGGGSGAVEPFVREMRELEEDEHVRAVVLRINSPGGSALASDRMWQSVDLLSQRVPVVVSIGDMAASGGYYIAVAGDEILAQPSSIVGSIGVVGGKVSIAGSLERIGVHPETLTRGRHAAWSTLTTTFSDEERAIVQRMMDSTYERFVSLVVAGRARDWASIEAVAQGRVWSGADGIERGLVDGVGGLDTAIAHARARAGVGDDLPIVEWPETRTVLDMVAESMGADGDPEAQVRALATRLAMPAALRPLAALGAVLETRPHVALSMPVAIVIE